TTTPGGSEPPRNDISPTDMPPVGCENLAACPTASVGSAEAATDAAPRLRRNDLRERPELVAWLMDRLLNINLESIRCCDRAETIALTEIFPGGMPDRQGRDRMSIKLHQIHGHCTLSAWNRAWLDPLSRPHQRFN